MAHALLCTRAMLASIQSAGTHGIDAYRVLVEVDCALQGIPGWHFTGLPEAAVKESKERVWAALRYAGFQLRAQKITINLAPARRKKVGNYFDLPIAVGLLVASGAVTQAQVERHLFLGELQLSGALQGVPGALSIALHAQQQGCTLVGPAANRDEFALVRGLRFVAADSLSDVVRYLQGESVAVVAHPRLDQSPVPQADLADVQGQPLARRALEIAAAGHHHLLLYGPPGTGKTMLAERLPGILPPMHYEEAIDTTRIYSAIGCLAERALVTTRPFRAPHHSASTPGLAGGGTAAVRAGEMSLAHHGVLFFDEFPEFRRDALEALRQPLESGRIALVRANQQLVLPARFLFVAACKPCRCGYYGHPKIACQCSLQQVQHYRAKLSGPLMDRIDLHVALPTIPTAQLTTSTRSESSAVVQVRVVAARTRQHARYGQARLSNGLLSAAQTRKFCIPTADARMLLLAAIDRHGLSARVYDRVLRMSRTIADLAGHDTIEIPHIAEALQFRGLDRPL